MPSPGLLSLLPRFVLSDTLGKEVKWPDSMYPDLHMPYAPSWSLHWAYRDGHLVNLPVSLLVEGDVIALRPGQESFASLRGIKVTCLSYFPGLERCISQNLLANTLIPSVQIIGVFDFF